MRLIPLVLLCVTGCAPKSAVSRIETLEAQVAALEAEMSRLADQRQPNRGDRPPEPDQAFTDAVQAFERAAYRAAEDGRMAGLKQDCRDFREKHRAQLATDAGQRAWRRASRVCDEAEVIGMKAPALRVGSWLQGSAPAPSTPQLLVFWEVWCPHCRREVPELVQLQDRFETRMQVVGLTKMNRGTTEERVRDFIDEQDLDFPIGKDQDGALSQAYNVTGVPAAAFVRDGIVVWRGHPARLSDATMERLITGP